MQKKRGQNKVNHVRRECRHHVRFVYMYTDSIDQMIDLHLTAKTYSREHSNTYNIGILSAHRNATFTYMFR